MSWDFKFLHDFWTTNFIFIKISRNLVEIKIGGVFLNHLMLLGTKLCCNPQSLHPPQSKKKKKKKKKKNREKLSVEKFRLEMMWTIVYLSFKKWQIIFENGYNTSLLNFIKMNHRSCQEVIAQANWGLAFETGEKLCTEIDIKTCYTG